MASPGFFRGAARFGEERQHPEFDVRERNLGWQVGQFPSDKGTPGDDHGGGALKAFGRLVPRVQIYFCKNPVLYLIFRFYL